jgi:serine-type D-Ala-D-Ala carboxypeptidase/endopeptidase
VCATDSVLAARKFLHFLCLVIGLFAFANRIPAAPPPLPSDAEIKAILRTFIERDHWGVGMVVGIVDEQGTRIVSYGKMDNGDSPEVNGDTLFEVGSVTKTFTTLLLEDMIQRGEMKLEDPVEKFLPGSVKVPRWGARKITLFDLATHTSGLPRDLEGEVNEARLYDFLSHCRLARKPGRKVEYSNLGVLLLGHAIQLKAGTNYEALLEERICRPLNMDSTCITVTPALRARLAKSHNKENRPAGDLADQLAPLPGCGAIRSTANDMLQYVAANIGLANSPLTPLMEKTHVVRFPHAMEEIDVAMPWWVYHRRGAEFITHGGCTMGHQAFIGFDKQAKRGVVVLANREDVLEQAVRPLGMYLLSPPAEPPVRAKVAREVLDGYAGLYVIPDFLQVLLTLRREGDELRAQLMSSAAMPECIPVSDTEFVDSWGSGGRMKLIPGAGGRMTVEFTRPQCPTRRGWRVSNRVPERLFEPVSEPLVAGEYTPRKDSDLQGTWDLRARLWYFPFVSKRGTLRVAEPSPGVFRAEFDFPQLEANNLPVSVIYYPPGVELVTRIGAGMFQGKLNADHTKIKGHYFIGHFSFGTTLQRARQ